MTRADLVKAMAERSSMSQTDVDKVLDELAQWKGTVLTTMLVSGPPELLGQIAELVG